MSVYPPHALTGHATAMHRRIPSAPMRHYERLGLLRGRVLDYGSGRDPHRWPKFDPYHAPEYSLLQPHAWDTITANYVLNVIPTAHGRLETLLTLRGLLAPGGHILIAIHRGYTEHTITARGYQCAWRRSQWDHALNLFFSAERLTAPFWAWRLQQPEAARA